MLSIPIPASVGATHSATAPQTDYLSALSAVDHFLQAWQSGDAENGIALLTSHAKQAATTEIVEKFFSTETSSAYEIERGKMLKRGRYEFPIVLMTSRNNRVHRQFSRIVVLNTGGNDWAIDKLS
jgi:hypothetical protein